MRKQVKAVFINTKPLKSMSRFGTLFVMIQKAGNSRRVEIRVEEIAKELGLSRASVYAGQRHLQRLGWIRRSKWKHDNILPVIGWEIALVDAEGNPSWGDAQ